MLRRRLERRRYSVRVAGVCGIKEEIKGRMIFEKNCSIGGVIEYTKMENSIKSN
jgi:hypothetical protein